MTYGKKPGGIAARVPISRPYPFEGRGSILSLLSEKPGIFPGCDHDAAITLISFLRFPGMSGSDLSFQRRLLPGEAEFR